MTGNEDRLFRKPRRSDIVPNSISHNVRRVRYIWDMKWVMCAFCCALVWAQDPVPTELEMREAFYSKAGHVGPRVFGRSVGTWRVKEIRGWKIKFKELDSERQQGFVRVNYRGTAQKQTTCAAYEITQTIPTGPPPQYVKPNVTVSAPTTVPCQ
jgi:hypothetical protein